MSDGSVKIGVDFDQKQFTSKLANLGKSSMKALAGAATALNGLGAAAIKAGIAYESAFAGVLKTVNFDDTTISIKEMSDGIRNMAKEIPMAATEIAGIAEAAGQLGIKTNNILGFTRVMADLGVATNLTGQQAATTFARFANITGMSQDDFSNLGSAIVELGNNMATTEAEIADLALNLAAAGTQIGLSEPQILGLAAAMSSLGIESASGGTALSRVMSEMQLAVETGSGKLSQFASIAGMTSAEFTELFKGTPKDALLSFIEGLDKGSDSATKLLDDIGMGDRRVSDSLKRMAGAGTMVADAMDMSSDAFKSNSALATEAAQRYETLESKLIIIGNAFTDIGIAFSQSIDGPLNEMAQKTLDIINNLSAAFDEGGLDGLVSEIGTTIALILTDLSSAVPEMVDAGTRLVLGLLRGLVDNADTLALGGAQIVSSLLMGIISIAPEIASTAITFIKALIPQLAAIAPELVVAGADMIKGLVVGMTSALPDIGVAIGHVIAEGDILIKAVGVIGTALMAFKVGSAIQSGVDALTAAFRGLNGVMSASPVGIFAAGIAVASVAAIALYNHTHQLTEETKALIAENQKLHESYEQLLKDSTQATQSDSERLEDILDTNAAAKDLASTIYTMASAEEKDANAKMMLHAQVQQLNTLIPGLGLAYDSVTDSMNMSADAVDALVEGYKAKSYLERSQSRAVELTKEEAAINRQLTDAYDAQRKSLENKAAEQAKAKPDPTAIKAYHDEAAKLDTVIVGLSDSLKSNQDAQGALNENMAAAIPHAQTWSQWLAQGSKKQEEYAESTEKAATATSHQSEAQAEGNGLEQQGLAINAQLQASQTGMADDTDAFTESLLSKNTALREGQAEQDAQLASLQSATGAYSAYAGSVGDATSSTEGFSASMAGAGGSLMTVDEYLASMKANATQLTDAETELADVQQRLADINEQLSEKIADATKSTEENAAENKGLISLQDELKAKETELVETSASLKKERDDLTKSIMGNSEAISENKEVNKEALAIEQEAAANAAAHKKAIDEIKQTYAGYAESTTNAFGKIKQEQTVSVRQMIKNLESNQQATQKWSDGLAKLAESDLDKGFLQKLRDLGPAGAKQVEALVKEMEKGAKGKFPELVAALEKGLKDAEEATKLELSGEDLQTSIDATITSIAEGLAAATVTATVPGDITVTPAVNIDPEAESIETQVSTLANSNPQETSVPVDVKAAPTVTIEGGAGTINKQIETQVKAQPQSTSIKAAVKVTTDPITVEGGSEAVAQKLEDSLNVEAQTIKVPVTVEVAPTITGAVEIGTSIISKITVAIGANASAIKTTLQTAVNSAKGVSVSGFDSIGKNMCEGVASGIRNGTSSITAAINAAAAAARAAFQSAMQIASPSKVMMEDGEYVSEGIAVGIKKGIPMVEAAMKAMGDVIKEMSDQNTEAAQISRMEAITSEIASIEKILDEYQRMLDDKQAEKELADKRAAVKNAKNKKDRIKAQEALNDHLKKLEMERLKDQKDFLQAEIDAYEKNVKTLVDHYNFMGDQIIIALKNRYEGERDMQLERLEAEYDAATEAADRLYDYQKKQSDAYLKLLEDERDAEINILQGRIDEINAEIKAEKEAERIRRDAEKIAELEAAVARAKNAKFRNEAQKKLDEELLKQANEARDRERQAEIESLKDQISDAKDNFTEQKTLEEERIDALEEAHKTQIDMLKANYDQQKKATEQHYKELLSADRLNAEARRLLLQESNEEMLELLNSYNPDWYNAGKSFGELFVEALGVQMENVNRLIEEAASFAGRQLDIIRAQIAEMNSVGSGGSVGSGSAMGSGGYMPSTVSGSAAGAGGYGTTQNISVNINQPVQSPSEVAYAVQKTLKEAAYGI